MKKTLILGLMAAIIGFASCGGSDDDTPGDNPSTATTGTATRKGNVSVKWVKLWKDGPKFAEYNIGALSNKANDYGDLFTWGGKKNRDVSEYSTSGRVLSGDNDTATYLWGSNWRTPRKEELEALLANCTVKWETVNGANGCRFTGKGDYSHNSIFLPATGEYDYTDLDLKYPDLNGFYWSSTPTNGRNAYYMTFPAHGGFVGSTDRQWGFSIRPVLAN